MPRSKLRSECIQSEFLRHYWSATYAPQTNLKEWQSLLGVRQWVPPELSAKCDSLLLSTLNEWWTSNYNTSETTFPLQFCIFSNDCRKFSFVFRISLSVEQRNSIETLRESTGIDYCTRASICGRMPCSAFWFHAMNIDEAAFPIETNSSTSSEASGDSPRKAARKSKIFVFVATFVDSALRSSFAFCFTRPSSRGSGIHKSSFRCAARWGLCLE